MTDSVTKAKAMEIWRAAEAEAEAAGRTAIDANVAVSFADEAAVAALAVFEDAEDAVDGAAWPSQAEDWVARASLMWVARTNAAAKARVKAKEAWEVAWAADAAAAAAIVVWRAAESDLGEGE